ncbi:phosphotransferase family protein [Pseudomonas sp. GD03721]|nr:MULTISPECIES: phosphotransferase family protein [unclassified Pseudomonas]MDH1440438.1 phosphotransferase family protein [Pseudomonas sp. GD03722]WGG03474.1 phosphotransferase family protein [Pseudomonas sp. GD03721]WGG07642.1 phosphotransferase family protein [Pseudomonas sp. GD03919]
MPALDKNDPAADWIETLRLRYPCERELDRILTRKMRLRSGPAYTPVTLETLVAGTRSLLASSLPDAFELTDARWLSGGASKLQMQFSLRWNKPGIGWTDTPMVLRMEPAESITETSRLREFQIIRALAGQVPVPPTYWVDATAAYLPYPAIIYGFADGVTKPTSASSNVSGIGTSMPASLRQPLGRQLVEQLAALHGFDWRQADIDAFDKPAPGTQALEWQLNRWARVWEEDANEDVPLMRLAAAWLRQNMPPVKQACVVHGDFRVGNFLFTEHDTRITAWLDWELSYLGDPHEDLAWVTKDIFGHMAEDGHTFLVGGLIPRDEFFGTYEALTGFTVDPKTLQYYDLFSNFKSVAICLATGYRATRNGKTHQDVVVAWLAGIGYRLLDELRQQLEEVL